MRLVSYLHEGRASFGVAVADEIADLATPAVATLRDALVQWEMREVRRRFAGANTRIPVAAVQLLPPIVNPDKIFCVGLNYRAHADEAGLPIPQYPAIFMRSPGSQVGHESVIWRPLATAMFDYEAELAVIIGRRGRHIAVAEALDFVAGLSCFAENSARDFQHHATQITPGKNFHASGAFGPALTTLDEIPDLAQLQVIGRLNGVVMQRDRLCNMLFSVSELIAYLSSFAELLPGDVIATGTPAGVGCYQHPPRYLQPGDIFEVEIPDVGLLRNRVINEPR